MNTQNKYVNRELSWLKFNARVLQEAADQRVPLLERLRFAGIFSNNLDEFFKVRYATVKRVATNEAADTELGMHAKELLEEITREVIALQNESLEIIDSITTELEKEQIFMVNERTLLPEHEAFVNAYFYNKVRPALFTIILNDLERFPQLKDDVAYLAIKMILKKVPKSKDDQRFFSSQAYKEPIQYALIELPSTLDRFVELPQVGERHYIIMLDDIIRFCLHKIFNIFDYESLSAHMIKITRDAELDIDDDLSKSFVEKISTSVEDRRKGEPVRFVYDKEIDEDTLQFLFEKMHIISTDSVIPGGRYHNRRDYMNFPSLGRKDLTYAPIEPLPVKGLSSEESLLKKIAKKDFLQYTPYHTFSNIIWFLREAALDPKVKSVKITIYRLAKNSQVVNSLINAVKNGKKVTVQIELQARFDEESNIRYAEMLKAEGVKLVFGVKGLKVHSKICVIEREEGKGIKKYGFISTGNFNESTARVYTDYTLFTANQEILKDVNKVFNFFDTNYNVQKYKHLIVSPHYTKKALIALIDREIDNALAGKEAFIHLKMNNITSYKMIDKLYEASRAGVKIRMIVRGICCLVPGVKNLSENIEVISIVDKFLEHPRLFIFGNDGDPKVFISSADWMTRNISFRVEVGCPIYDNDIKRELIDTFRVSWDDNVKARIIDENNDNRYKPHTTPAIRSQLAMYEYYQTRIDD
ncbi:polyphosphate kinase [Capnocytophaga haemolytica]|uniref:Polyphosphate kinase n=1 Tax=Capnocytophaga haemolytica TaxID=45243 RepID=A0AAX2GTX2_9FLAO|nr:polyphosphate kinase 1 [Capnocytophaga haemolytica]AMD85494.1 polyphosphate kinase [Capnocytophaga haemolytica]SFO17875.1 polyphosphate kinase [Capnocytophaga haemolytica]SNV01026.1 Polyphosphate kinase [Capnocytophaga haemolytica]